MSDKDTRLLTEIYGEKVLPITFGIIDRHDELIKDKTYNVCFIAAGHEEEGIRCKIFKQLSKVGSCYMSDVERKRDWLDYIDYANILKTSLIGVSARGVGYDTYRYYEIVYFGAMLYSEEPTIEIPDGFIDGKHCVYFKKDLSDFKDKLYYYFRNIEEAKKIAKAGREYLMKKHTSLNRASYVLDCIGRLK